MRTIVFLHQTTSGDSEVTTVYTDKILKECSKYKEYLESEGFKGVVLLAVFVGKRKSYVESFYLEKV